MKSRLQYTSSPNAQVAGDQPKTSLICSLSGSAVNSRGTVTGHPPGGIAEFIVASFGSLRSSTQVTEWKKVVLIPYGGHAVEQPCVDAGGSRLLLSAFSRGHGVKRCRLLLYLLALAVRADDFLRACFSQGERLGEFLVAVLALVFVDGHVRLLVNSQYLD